MFDSWFRDFWQRLEIFFLTLFSLCYAPESSFFVVARFSHGPPKKSEPISFILKAINIEHNFH